MQKFTEEQRREAQAKLTAKREENIKRLRTDFADSDHWDALAVHFDCRLPAWWIAPEPKNMRKWLRKFRIKPSDYLSITGYDNLEAFSELNPEWPLRAWVGLVLEYAEEKEGAEDCLKNHPDMIR